ncbi:restriction endonuclease subunit S [Dietzia cercidiphylli]|uniref:restriction endonuclease subunit S n=1 Tax=Dietzia cercidiphylli TaxID=498199 RepID=UPI003F8193A0
MKLGDLMVKRAGTVDPLKYPDEIFDLYSIPAFDSGQPAVVPGSEIGSSKPLVAPNDVLLSRIVPHIRRAWIVGDNRGRRLIGSGEWMIFRSEQIHPRWLRHVLVGDRFHAQLMQTVAGVGGSLMRARPAHVATIEVPLPPLPEQRRIAAILDHTDALRAKRREALTHLDELNQSIFVDMFAGVARSNQSVKLNDVASISSGITKGRKLNGANVRPIPYLAVANVQEKSLELTVVKTINATDAEIDRLRLRRNDLLLTEGGDPDKLGRGSLWREELPEAIHQNHIFRVRPDVEQVNPIYLNWAVGSRESKAYFLRSAKQTTGIASINMSQLKALPLDLPPLELQENFAERVERLEEVRGQHRTALAELDSLFASLQSRAFRGEL